MKRNRREKRHSIFTVGVVQVAAIGVIGFALLMLYSWLDIGCNSVGQEIGKAEKRLKMLDEELDRENVHFSQMTTTEELERALRRHGLAMNLPAQDQVIHMGTTGRVRPGQLSVARAQRRNGAPQTAVVQGAAPRAARLRGSSRTIR